MCGRGWLVRPALAPLRFAACDAEFVALFENGRQPLLLAAGNRYGFGNRAWRGDRQAGEAPAQIFGCAAFLNAGLG